MAEREVYMGEYGVEVEYASLAKKIVTIRVPACVELPDDPDIRSKCPEKEPDFGGCVDKCLKDNYTVHGYDTHEIASDLSVFSIPSFLLNEYIEFVEQEGNRSATRRSYQGKSGFEHAQRMRKLLGLLGRLNAFSLVVGIGAGAYQATGYIYCTSHCATVDWGKE